MAHLTPNSVHIAPGGVQAHQAVHLLTQHVDLALGTHQLLLPLLELVQQPLALRLAVWVGRVGGVRVFRFQGVCCLLCFSKGEY